MENAPMYTKVRRHNTNLCFRGVVLPWGPGWVVPSNWVGTGVVLLGAGDTDLFQLVKTH